MRHCVLFATFISVAALTGCSSAPKSEAPAETQTTTAPATPPAPEPVADPSAGEKAKGKEFQAKAAKEAGAVVTPSGLVYRSLKTGTGPSPVATSVVTMNYRGTLIDGTEFDSSYKRNEPLMYPLNNLIPCWIEGVQKMKVGGKAQLVCPSDIAYGDIGHPPDIPGGATLVFQVELLKVN